MLILAMTFSGSIVFCTIFLCSVLGSKLLSPAWVYNMLKINLIFFCIPLPVYSAIYRNRLLDILGVPAQQPVRRILSGYFIGIDKGGKVHLDFSNYIIAVWAVWMCGLLALFIRNMCKYRKEKTLKANPPMNRLDYLAVFDKVKKELGIKKGVTLLCADAVKTVCTMGVFRKYVIVPERGMTKEEIYYSLKHELIHVKRADVAWRYIGLSAVLLHWFNPLAYLFFYTMSVYCEQSCDAILVQNLDRAARKKYGELIINMSRKDEFGRWEYQTNLCGSKKIMRWRLSNMMENRKKNRVKTAASLLLGAMVLFGGSLTVCAYEEPPIMENVDATVFEMRQDGDEIFVVADEIRYSEEEVLDFTEFVGEDGVSYRLSEMPDSNIERVGCTHSYASGYVGYHCKNADGSCKTDYYYADYCSKCGHVVEKGYSHTVTYTRCTHRNQ